ncbi:ROK family protein [Nocardioides sp. MAH-18]|uniref:ROK family protein n=1 Tax=Nocardioides agri TaxID=2682843 RepID=A0A6L6XVQ2_9ACTN|nr:ROK family protein [Nocardioides sp. CGMCC 1.13656]MVQ50556.1 ROK family protein [Nocardioides sp. MAH-18]
MLSPVTQTSTRNGTAPAARPDGRDSAAPATAGELLDLVRSGRASTRSQLRALTGLSRTAITTRVSSLTSAGLLLLGEELASTGGRPPGALVFNQHAGVVLAIAIGRSRSQLAVADLDGQELASDSRDHEVGVGPDELMTEIAQRLATLLDGVTAPVWGVGLSLAGTLDPDRGVSIGSPVMSGWDGVELAPYLESVTRAPLFVGNDADVLARSQLLGRSAALEDVLVVKASTGLGLGIIADGRVLSGHIGAAGEIGHTKVPAADGLPCRCGATGCLETLAGGWALVDRAQEAGRDIEHVRDLVALALQGDPAARGLLRDSGRALGEVLAVAINLLNPAAVVIGGDMEPAFDFHVAGVRESVYALAAPLATRDLQFLPAAHGDRAGVVGCAALALDHVLAPVAVDLRLADQQQP